MLFLSIGSQSAFVSTSLSLSRLSLTAPTTDFILEIVILIAATSAFMFSCIIHIHLGIFGKLKFGGILILMLQICSCLVVM